jgi:hypothetical protein
MSLVARAAGTAAVLVWLQIVTQAGNPVSQRYQQWEVDERDKQYTFLHISKCGGASFIAQAMNMSHTVVNEAGWTSRKMKPTSQNIPYFGKFYPPTPQGAEEGFLWQKHLFPDAFNLVLLRDPRSHVLSLYKECRYNWWGERAWETARKNKKPWTQGTQVEGLHGWLTQYQDHPESYVQCYHPWNYQARALSSDDKSPHNAKEGALEPDRESVMKSYFDMDWVGLTNFYHESKCLLVYRLSANGAVSNYLDDKCRCSPDGTAPPLHEARVTHELPGKGKMESRVPMTPDLAAKIDSITASPTLIGISLPSRSRIFWRK